MLTFDDVCPVYLRNHHLAGHDSPSTMSISAFLKELVSNLSEENYEKTLSDYRFWMKIGTTHGCALNNKLQDDILNNRKPDLVYPTSSRLIHPTSQRLLQFITDVEQHLVSPTHTRLSRSLLNEFFDRNLRLGSQSTIYSSELSSFYTNVGFLAHWVNLGYIGVEDVRDNILQSLTFRPVPLDHQLHSLLILLKIAGATFAVYVDPSIMDRCLNVLKSRSNMKSEVTALTKVRAFFSGIMISHECRKTGCDKTIRE